MTILSRSVIMMFLTPLRNVLIIKGFNLENFVKSSPILKIPKPNTTHSTSGTILSTIHFFQEEIYFFQGKDKVKSSRLRFLLDNVNSHLVITWNCQTDGQLIDLSHSSNGTIPTWDLLSVWIFSVDGNAVSVLGWSWLKMFRYNAFKSPIVTLAWHQPE